MKLHGLVPVLLLSLAVAGGAAPGAQAAATAPALPDASAAPDLGGEVYEHTLSNGLHVVVVRRPGLKLAAVNLTVRVGAVDDPDGASGMGHVLEHTTLSGSATLGSLNPEEEQRAIARLDKAASALAEAAHREPPADEAELAELEREFTHAKQAALALSEPGEPYGRRLESRGAIGLNAATGADTTQYFARLPVEEVGRWIAMEADRLRHPVFRGYYRERGVILKEVDDLTQGRLTSQEVFLDEVFPGGPSANPVAGRPDEIAGIDRFEAMDFFLSAYRPELTVITVIGDVDPGEVFAACEEAFTPWRAGAPPLEPPPQSDEPRSLPYVRKFNSLRAPIVLAGFPTPPLLSDDGAALEAVAELLNSDTLSPLHHHLVSTGAAWSVGAAAHYPSARYPSVFLVHFYGMPGTPHEDLIAAGRRALEELAALPSGELLAAARRAEVRLAGEIADPLSLAATLASHQAVHGDWRILLQRLEGLRALQPEDMRRAILTYLDPTALGPPEAEAPAAQLASDDGAGDDGAAAGGTTAEASAESAAGGGGELTLPSGLRVLLERTASPGYTEALLVVDVGTRDDPVELEGAADVTRLALLGGDDGLRAELARSGIQVDSVTGERQTLYRFAVPKDETLPFVARLHNLLRPTPLAPDRWSMAGDQWLQGKIAESQTLWQAANQRLTDSLWPDTHDAQSRVAPQDRTALERFRREHYRPDRAVLAVWGPVPVDAVERVLHNAWGDLPRSSAAPIREEELAAVQPDPTNPEGTTCLFVDGAEPPLVLYGIGATAKADEDFYGWELLAHILAGGHGSRLHRRLRLEEGLVHTVAATGLPRADGGLTLRIDCQSPEPARVLAVVDEELHRLVREGVEPAELEAARSLLQSRLLLDQDSHRDRFHRRALELLTGDPGRDPARAQEVLSAMTPETLRAMLERAVENRALASVVVAEENLELCGISRASVAGGSP